MTFLELGIAPQIVTTLEEAGITEPTPIQQQTIVRALKGSSLVATSQTGSGKTLSYLLPIAQSLTSNKSAHCLVLAPTRELAQQIHSVCNSIFGSDISSAVIVGGVEYAPQREALERNPQIIIATPGRLIDLITQGYSAPQFSHFVLDEVDQMLDLGFREPITQLARLRSAEAQSLCFSATLPSSVEELLTEIVPASERVTVAGEAMAVASIDMYGYYVMPAMMDMLLLHLLRGESPEQAIIFTRSRKMADRITKLLADNGYQAEAMHSDRSQAAREHIIARFRALETKIIVATDVIARGIDIESVSHIFNYGLPLNAEQYVHRCGRCGRAGRAGRALSLINPEDKALVDTICKMMKRHMNIVGDHPYLTPEVARTIEQINNPKPKSRGKRPIRK